MIAQLIKDGFGLARVDVEMRRDAGHAPALVGLMQEEQERLEMRYGFDVIEDELAHVQGDEVIGHKRPLVCLIR